MNLIAGSLALAAIFLSMGWTTFLFHKTLYSRTFKGYCRACLVQAGHLLAAIVSVYAAVLALAFISGMGQGLVW